MSWNRGAKFSHSNFSSQASIQIFPKFRRNNTFSSPENRKKKYFRFTAKTLKNLVEIKPGKKKTSNFKSNFWLQVSVKVNSFGRYGAKIAVRAKQCIISLWRATSGADEYLLPARETTGDSHSIRMHMLRVWTNYLTLFCFLLPSFDNKKQLEFIRH